MASLSALPRSPRNRVRVRSLTVHVFSLLVSATLCASSVASATSAPDPQRFQLLGSGTLNLDQPVQRSKSVQLKATLTPTDATLAAAPPVQVGGRFALTASLTTASLVCYNDTIFRDSFDGTGF